MCLKKFSSELEQFGLASSSRVAVGTLITERPPHRSRRALLTHRAYMRTRLSRGRRGSVPEAPQGIAVRCDCFAHGAPPPLSGRPLHDGAGPARPPGTSRGRPAMTGGTAKLCGLSLGSRAKAPDDASTWSLSTPAG